MSDMRENVLEKVRELEEKVQEARAEASSRAEKIERRFVDQKQGFRRAVAEAPLFWCGIMLAVGFLLGCIVATSVVLAP